MNLQNMSELLQIQRYIFLINEVTLSDFKIMHKLENVPEALQNCVLAIGNFDGCHLGHQRIFSSALDIAKASNAPALVLSFEPHPRDVFAPKPFIFRLTDGQQKAQIVKALGFDGIIIMPFDRDLAAMEAQDFVQKYFIDALNVKAICVGEDFHFGKNRKGTPEFLAHSGSKNGFEVHQLNLLVQGQETISSSRIRKCLSEDGLNVANRLLNYHWIVEGIVIEGDRRGRELGYPTANFVLPNNSNLAQGVYAVRVKLGERLFDSVASFGKPMFNNSQPPFEVHIFDFDEDIYGQNIEVALIEHIRGQMIFDNLDELIVQMDKDSEKARNILSNIKPISALDANRGIII